MAIKETLIHTRPSTNVLWFHEWQQSQPNPKTISLTPTYGDYFNTTSTESENGLTLEVVRMWNDKLKFIESRTILSDSQVDLEYFNYLFDNGIIVTKITEQL